MRRFARSAGNSSTMGEAFAKPGMDTRDWLSYGTVSDDTPVTMDPDMGPLVGVVLQPSKIEVRSRVLMQSAGKGEGEYIPFVSGDEVLVAIPEGHPWSGTVILGRLTNSIDKFPTGSVAGQDASKNNFAFKRTRTAWIHEVEGGYLIREAKSGAFFQLDGTNGNVTIRDGSGGALQVTKSALAYQSADGKKVLQVDVDNGRFRAQVDDALMLMASTSQGKSALVVPGTYAVSSSAQPAAEHVATTEAVLNIVLSVLQALGTANPGPVLGATLTAPFLGTTAIAGLQLAAVTPLLPTVATAIQGAFALAQQKPPAVPSLGQLAPGIGCVGFRAG
jgi:hypothetical protein